jgi:hypothetical protein
MCYEWLFRKSATKTQKREETKPVIERTPAAAPSAPQQQPVTAEKKPERLPTETETV